MQDQSAILEGSLWRAVPRFALPVAAALAVRPSRSFASAPSARHGEKAVS